MRSAKPYPKSKNYKTMTIEHENQKLLRAGYPPLADCETLHTPGPWAIETCNENGPFSDSFYLSAQVKTWDGNDDERIVCRFPTGTGQFSETGREHLANARLISAAPDMFDALQAIVDAFGDRDSLLIDQAKAALAKATP